MDSEPIVAADARPEPGPAAPPETDGLPPARQAAPPPVAAAPTLKLVVQLLPAGEGGTSRALLSLGRDGCDPELRAVEADDLAAALDEVPALLADAEARWSTQPRYPSAPPARRPATASQVQRPAQGTRTPSAPAAPRTAPVAQPEDQRAQLDLFS